MINEFISRRDFSARLAGFIPVLGIAGTPRILALPHLLGDDDISHTAEAIHQEVNFAASPKKVYDALTIQAQFSKMTGGLPTELKATAGAAFSLFGARIKGRNVELVVNERLVQAWRSEGWPAGIYSIVRFELKADGAGTKLIFDHTGFPMGEADHLEAGWKMNYWDNLAKFLA